VGRFEVRARCESDDEGGETQDVSFWIFVLVVFLFFFLFSFLLRYIVGI